MRQNRTYAPQSASASVRASEPGKVEQHTEMEAFALEVDGCRTWWSDGKKSGNLWIYNVDSGLWSSDGWTLLRNMYGTRYAENTTDEKGRKANYAKALQEFEVYFMTRQTDHEEEFPIGPDNLIPFKNGVYDLDQKRLIEYLPEHYFTSKLPWDFNEKAKCDWFLRLFGEWVRSPQELIDMLGLCLYRRMPLQKIFMLLGSGNNGKTMALQILTRALGDANVSTLPIHQFGERFAEISLYHKLANIVDELAPDAIRDAGVLKRVTGESPVSADVKHRARITFTSYATQIVAMNQLPPTNDKSDAFYRRVHLIDFPFKIPAEKIDRQLSTKLAAETENYEGLLYLAIQALDKARSNNWVFDGVRPRSVEEIRLEYSHKSDTVDFLLENFCEGEEGEHVAHASIVLWVNRMRKATALDPLTPWFIRSRMEAAGYDRERIKIGNDFQFAWLNLSIDIIRLNEWFAINEPPKTVEITGEIQDWIDSANTIELRVLKAVYSGITSNSKISLACDLNESETRAVLRSLGTIRMISTTADGACQVTDRARRAMVEAALKGR